MDINSVLSKDEIPEINTLSPLTLAFLGDSVYEMFVRTKILASGNRPASELHKIAVGYVKAKAQADAAHKILDMLTDDELAIYKRGRNTNIHTVPKNADMADYRHATALETLIGYLYLKGEEERLIKILNAAFDSLS
ncbi:MAG: Mini-ribonuclease 3 [Clostridia bacterium]|nr:Mini-ribonuclease 3 [Clostridia bacterium]